MFEVARVRPLAPDKPDKPDICPGYPASTNRTDRTKDIGYVLSVRVDVLFVRRVREP